MTLSPGRQSAGQATPCLSRSLQGVDDAHDLVEVSPDIERIVDHRTQLALWVNEEHSAHGRGGSACLVDHPVELRHLHVEVRDDRELDIDIEVLA